MAKVETEACKRIGCNFVDKKTGYCLRALALRKPKDEVCVSTVNIKVGKKKRV